MARLSEENRVMDLALANTELAPFAMFEIDLGMMRDKNQPADENGLHPLLFPELDGKSTPWWTVEAIPVDVAEVKQAAKDERQERIDAMAARVAAGQSPFDGNGDEYTEGGIAKEATRENDDWSHFWGGDSPTEKMTWIGEE